MAEPERWSVNGSARCVKDYQAQWCRNSLENQEQAVQSENKRPLILPGKLWEQEPLAGIRADTKV